MTNFELLFAVAFLVGVVAAVTVSVVIVVVGVIVDGGDVVDVVLGCRFSRSLE